jgi:hypothetical protein
LIEFLRERKAFLGKYLSEKRVEKEELENELPVEGLVHVLAERGLDFLEERGFLEMVIPSVVITPVLLIKAVRTVTEYVYVRTQISALEVELTGLENMLQQATADYEASVQREQKSASSH